jgi:hypothetical protein
MRRRGPVAREQRADLGQAETADDMREIHRHLAGERRSCRAPRGCPEVVHIHLEHRRDGGIDHAPEL